MVVICLNVSLPPPDCSGLQRWALPRAFACLALFYSWLVALGNASWGNEWMNEWTNPYISEPKFPIVISLLFLYPHPFLLPLLICFILIIYEVPSASQILWDTKRDQTIPQCRGADRYVRWLPFAENSSCAGFGLSTLPTRYLLILSKFPKLGNNYLHFTDENVKA